MVHIKTFGVFRLDTGVRELTMDASSVKALLQALPEEIKRLNPDAQWDKTALKGCIVSVNGKQVRPSAKLKDGDEVWLVPAVAGG